MKHLKLIILSVLFIVILIPGLFSSIWVINEIRGKNSYQNHEYMTSAFYTSNDEIGFLADYCKKNNYFGRTQGSEEQRLSDCIDAELRIQPLAYAYQGIMKYVSFVLIPIFLIYTWFYFKWIKRNYFNRKNY